MHVAIRFDTASLCLQSADSESFLASTNWNVCTSLSVTQASLSCCKSHEKEEEDSSVFIHVLLVKSLTVSDSRFLVLSLYHLVVLSVLQIGRQFRVLSLLSPVLRSLTLIKRQRRRRITEIKTAIEYFSYFDCFVLFVFVIPPLHLHLVELSQQREARLAWNPPDLSVSVYHSSECIMVILLW